MALAHTPLAIECLHQLCYLTGVSCAFPDLRRLCGSGCLSFTHGCCFSRLKIPFRRISRGKLSVLSLERPPYVIAEHVEYRVQIARWFTNAAKLGSAASGHRGTWMQVRRLCVVLSVRIRSACSWDTPTCLPCTFELRAVADFCNSDVVLEVGAPLLPAFYYVFLALSNKVSVVVKIGRIMNIGACFRSFGRIRGVRRLAGEHSDE